MCKPMQNYSHVRLLSSAIYGDVSLCQQASTSKDVAIKRMSLDHMARRVTLSDENVSVQENGLAEIKIMKSLPPSHNVVNLVDSFTKDGFENLVTDYCPNGDLFDHISKKEEESMEEVQQQFTQIAHGTAHLHENKVAHRDLSLENVLLDSDFNCKVSDLGLATTKSKCRPGRVGKAYYMSPEVYFEKKAYNPYQNDMWSLGIILFILMTKAPLYEEVGDCYYKALKEKGVRELLRQRKYPKNSLSNDAVDVLEALLNLNPKRRCTMSELLKMPFMKTSLNQRVKSYSSSSCSTDYSESSEKLIDCYSNLKSHCAGCDRKFHFFRRARVCLSVPQLRFCKRCAASMNQC